MNQNYFNVKAYIWLLFLALSLLFIFFPQIDLYVANLFYEDGSFPTKGTMLEVFFYKSVKVITTLMITLYIVTLVYYIVKRKIIFNISKKTLLFIFLVLTLAPGLIVNSTLKENWGRPRPVDIVQFGGIKKFTPPFVLSDQGGNSFSSGHTAAAFSLIGFAMLVNRRRQMWMGLALAYGTAVSVARMAAGGHFLSDVFTSFFIVWIVTHILYKLIFKKDS